jgi:hypothetical protein
LARAKTSSPLIVDLPSVVAGRAAADHAKICVVASAWCTS